MLGLLAEGMSGAAIAERLVLSPETVRTHVRNAMDKLGASTRSQAVALALEHGDIGEGDAPGAARGVSRPVARIKPGEGLDELASGLIDLADIDASAVYLADESGMVLQLAGHAESVAGDAALPPAEVILGEGGIGRVALERRSQLVSAGGPGSGGPMLAAPLVRAGRLSGVVCLGVRPSRPVSRREMLLLEAFAARVADVLASDREHTPQLRSALQRFRASWTGTLGT